MSTLHWSDTQAEIHKVVVGPFDNNVFVLRCRETGDAVLLDAANEHEKLLELCRALGVRRVLETHGHWDHIQAVPADARRRLRGRRHRRPTPPMLAVATTSSSTTRRVIEVGRLRLHTILTPGHTPGLDVLPGRGLAGAVQRRHALPRRPGQHQRSRTATSPPSSARSTTGSSRRSTADTLVLPGHGDDTTIGTERPHLQEWVDRGW